MVDKADLYSATWVGWLAIDHFFPAFETWSQFVAEDLQMAQELDGQRSSHAVEVEVRRAEEVEQIFDAISVSQLFCIHEFDHPSVASQS